MALDFDAALTRVLASAKGLSDINFTVGKAPQMEVDGALQPFEFAGLSGPLTPDDTAAIADAIIVGRPSLAEDLSRTGACDCAIGISQGTRFRVNIFSSRGKKSIVMRALPSELPSFEKLRLPPTLEEVTKLKNGLVVVTGSTGSGKSTTLAAIIDRINETRPVHILTLEDPIEFSHPHKQGTVNQRELGIDFPRFSDGLKAALRQAPKVILVGEMRDRETVEIGLKAAETGHLVLSTLHTVDAGQSISRITGMFESEERHLIRLRLAEVLRFAVAQRLLPKVGGGRVAAIEIMGSNLRTRELIHNGETPDKTFYQVIADAKPVGWQTFDQHIIEHFERGDVSEADARLYSSDRAAMGQALDRVKSAKGEQTSDIEDLSMVSRKATRR